MEDRVEVDKRVRAINSLKKHNEGLRDVVKKNTAKIRRLMREIQEIAQRKLWED